MLSFLSDPIGYKPGDRCLEMPDLRKAIEKKCRQLFIEEVQETEEETEVTEVSRREDSMDTNSMEEELSYAEKLAKEFDADLKNMVGTVHPRCQRFWPTLRRRSTLCPRQDS